MEHEDHPAKRQRKTENQEWRSIDTALDTVENLVGENKRLHEKVEELVRDLVKSECSLDDQKLENKKLKGKIQKHANEVRMMKEYQKFVDAANETEQEKKNLEKKIKDLTAELDFTRKASLDPNGRTTISGVHLSFYTIFQKLFVSHDDVNIMCERFAHTKTLLEQEVAFLERQLEHERAEKNRIKDTYKKALAAPVQKFERAAREKQ